MQGVRARQEVMLEQGRAPDGEEARGTCRHAEDGEGRALYREIPGVARDALFRTQSGPTCTFEVMLHSLRIIQTLQFCAHPPTLGDALAGQPGRPGPDSLSVAPLAVGAAPRTAAPNPILRLGCAGPWPGTNRPG